MVNIEPSPESLEENGDSDIGKKPNAVKNTLSAFSLARYETIQEDLQEILYRNRITERINRVIQGMEEDVGIAPKEDPGFVENDLAAMISAYGITYGGYHRLKVAAVTDEISRIIAGRFSYKESSDELLAIRLLVRTWRDRHFSVYQDPSKKTQNAFLMQFDLGYRFRRINFVLMKIGQLIGKVDQIVEEKKGLTRKGIQEAISYYQVQTAERRIIKRGF